MNIIQSYYTKQWWNQCSNQPYFTAHVITYWICKWDHDDTRLPVCKYEATRRWYRSINERVLVRALVPNGQWTCHVVPRTGFNCPEEYRPLSTFFTLIDKDGDRVLSKSEVQAAAGSLGLTATFFPVWKFQSLDFGFFRKDAAECIWVSHWHPK